MPNHKSNKTSIRLSVTLQQFLYFHSMWLPKSAFPDYTSEREKTPPAFAAEDWTGHVVLRSAGNWRQSDWRSSGDCGIVCGIDNSADSDLLSAVFKNTGDLIHAFRA